VLQGVCCRVCVAGCVLQGVCCRVCVAGCVLQGSNIKNPKVILNLFQNLITFSLLPLAPCILNRIKQKQALYGKS